MSRSGFKPIWGLITVQGVSKVHVLILLSQYFPARLTHAARDRGVIFKYQDRRPIPNLVRNKSNAPRLYDALKQFANHCNHIAAPDLDLSNTCFTACSTVIYGPNADE